MLNIENINKYFDNIDIIYWINLDRAVERRKNMDKVLIEFPVKNHRIQAIDGKELSKDELLSYFNVDIKKAKYTKYEYACSLSHLNTIKIFSETNYEYALILEDDVTLEFVKYWDKKISDIIKEAPSDWEIILLNYMYFFQLNNTFQFVRNNNIWSTQAYIIKNKTAKDIIKKYYINNKFNIMEFKNHSADHILYNMCKSYCYKYPYFTYSNMNFSSIHPFHYIIHFITKKNVITAWTNKYEKETFGKSNNFIYIFIIILIILLILHLSYQI